MAIAKLAIVTLTKKGTSLGQRLQTLVPSSELFAPSKFLTELEPNVQTYDDLVADVVGRLFGVGRPLALIMATGIAVRSIAPHLKNKHSDPPVVVLDELGEHVVSLISGHIGGANNLAQSVAALIGATPVVTTASDVSHGIAPDALAARYNWRIEPGSDLTGLAAALVNGDLVGILQDSGESDWQSAVAGNFTVYRTIDSLNKGKVIARMAITNRIIELEHGSPAVVFHPQNLVIGLGCNRGTTAAEIDSAIDGVLRKNGLSPLSIALLASVDLKKDELGLLEYSKTQGISLKFYPAARLAEIAVPSAPSGHALAATGTPSVAEAAALLASEADGLLVEKQAVGCQVTVAIAVASVAAARGKLSVVGIGPGDLADMSFRSRQAIDEAEVVVGYKMYLDLIRPLLAGKTLLSSGMTKEVDRTQEAVKEAGAGKKVALISSGDAGIYGMAGLAFEVAAEMGIEPEIEVVPGISAVSAAASLLGAPLMTDFCTISLSDYLTDWPKIEKRLNLAAEADLVIALYNPKSRKRPHQLEKAVSILLHHRDSDTPVGIVSDAYRPEQTTALTDLAHLTQQGVGMTSIVIVGNSQTTMIDGWMVTSRGYQKKYELA